jgi:hypothetical protein
VTVSQSSQDVRAAFVRKVYGVLFVQIVRCCCPLYLPRPRIDRPRTARYGPRRLVHVDGQDLGVGARSPWLDAHSHDWSALRHGRLFLEASFAPYVDLALPLGVYWNSTQARADLCANSSQPRLLGSLHPLRSGYHRLRHLLLQLDREFSHRRARPIRQPDAFAPLYNEQIVLQAMLITVFLFAGLTLFTLQVRERARVRS